jgi:hypothetical protein
MAITGIVEWAITAAATLPCRCPTSPLRRCGPSTIKLASLSCAAATMPFHVGAASIAMLSAADPAFSAIGPFIGGVQAEAHAWRPLFWIIAAIAGSVTDSSPQAVA